MMMRLQVSKMATIFLHYIREPKGCQTSLLKVLGGIRFQGLRKYNNFQVSMFFVHIKKKGLSVHLL